MPFATPSFVLVEELDRAFIVLLQQLGPVRQIAGYVVLKG